MFLGLSLLNLVMLGVCVLDWSELTLRLWLICVVCFGFILFDLTLVGICLRVWLVVACELVGFGFSVWAPTPGLVCFTLLVLELSGFYSWFVFWVCEFACLFRFVFDVFSVANDFRLF